MASRPMILSLKLSWYLLKQKVKGRKRFPLTMILEPLEACNLTCTGCGRIREYEAILDRYLSVDDCLRAVKECERAMQIGSYEPEVVMNTARLYVTLGCPLKAVEVLRRGLRQTPGHKGMLKQIDKLNPRRQPPLSFVGRNHPVNRQLAICLAKLSSSKGSQAPARLTNSLRRRALQTAR